MAERKKNNNTVEIVGTLVSAPTKIATAKNGHQYVSIKARVSSIFEGKEHVYNVSFFSMDSDFNGEHKKKFDTFCALENSFVGTRVKILAQLKEDRVFNKKTNQVSSYVGIEGNFIAAADPKDSDKATFELVGFVEAELAEKKNKDGATYRYDMKLGQARGTKLQILTVSAPVADTLVENGLRKYKQGDTCEIRGILDFTETQTTFTDENSGGFGMPITRVYTNTVRNYYVKGGSGVYTAEQEGYYSPDMIKELIAGYEAQTAELIENAHNDSGNIGSPVASRSEGEIKTKLESHQNSLL